MKVQQIRELFADLFGSFNNLHFTFKDAPLIKAARTYILQADMYANEHTKELEDESNKEVCINSRNELLSLLQTSFRTLDMILVTGSDLMDIDNIVERYSILTNIIQTFEKVKEEEKDDKKEVKEGEVLAEIPLSGLQIEDPDNK